MTSRRMIAVKGRQGIPVTVLVEVYRGRVWLVVDPAFISEAILDPANADRLIEILGQAVAEARGGNKDTVT